MSYTDFSEIKEIGSGCYATVYTAKYRKYLEEEYKRPFSQAERSKFVFGC